MTFTDVWGPSRVTGINGERYYISFTDGAKRRAVTYFMKKCSEVHQKMEEYDAFIFNQTGKHVQAFHCDNAKEYISQDVRNYLRKHGIRLELTAPYSPEQNGVAEHLNRTLIEHARAMLAAYNLPLFLWPEAVAYATYLRNRSPTRALGTEITPDEAFWGKKPNVASLQEFGTPCEVLQQDGKGAKIGPKTKPYIFTGLSDESRAWRYYNPDTRRILTSRNIFWLDTDKTASSDVPLAPPRLQGELYSAPEPVPIEAAVDPATKPASVSPHPTPARVPSASSMSTLTPTSSRISTLIPTPSHKAPRDISSAIDPNNIILGPRTRKYTKPDTALLAHDPISNDPLTIGEAESRPDWPEWQKAMDEEMALLCKLGTFTITPLPPGRTPIACKWVFRVKRDELGAITRYKARLVAKGFSQIPGIQGWQP
jgi:hypothetical protein